MVRKMKDSGIEWIGQIPENWTLPRVKNLFEIGRGRVISQLDLEDEGYPVYSSQTKNNGCLGFISTYDFDRSQLTWTTDGANAGTVFLREGKHNCTNVCGTLMPKNNDNNLHYLKYSLEFIAIYHKRADTNGFKIMNNEMAEIKLTLPSQKEQQKIADFLDEKVGEIDSAIEKTKATIEDYKKYKKTVISESVTHGLNSNVKMKPSGIPWIEEIPENWEVLPIKYILCWKSEKNHPDEQVLSLYRDLGIIPKDSRDDNHNATSEDTSSYKFVEVGDFVINKMKAWQGSMAVSDYQGIVSPAYHVCKFTRDDINKKYFHYLLRNQLYLPEFRRLSTGLRIGQWDLGFEDFKRIPFVLPPLDEQSVIVDYLDKKCLEIDNLIASKEAIVDELETYKKSLIYEYVTGKKEVK